MSHGDGSNFNYLMFGGVYLPLNEPVFPEQHYITRGDGFIPRQILPFVVHNWQGGSNRAGLPAWEHATNNASALHSAEQEPLLGDTDERSAFVHGRTLRQRILGWTHQAHRTLTLKLLASWDSVLRANRFVKGKMRSLFRPLRRY